jgi:hypothetical protein
VTFSRLYTCATYLDLINGCSPEEALQIKAEVEQAITPETMKAEQEKALQEPDASVPKEPKPQDQ